MLTTQHTHKEEERHTYKTRATTMKSRARACVSRGGWEGRLDFGAGQDRITPTYQVVVDASKKGGATRKKEGRISREENCRSRCVETAVKTRRTEPRGEVTRQPPSPHPPSCACVITPTTSHCPSHRDDTSTKKSTLPPLAARRRLVFEIGAFDPPALCGKKQSATAC
ncbi:hypothetical protein LSTR_LSTR004243 [Laodelphax striatellus]|uniref:Uncharacterized protein n=1 Tax=Laodelphax striatellus TaxID=195883 RepID=A0A482XCC9_LAOST|nr:hypothetical protein LSTR_LSTR004243 [Laodelphax striatellus]